LFVSRPLQRAITVIAFGIAIASWAVSGPLYVLGCSVVATPCPLILAAPIAVISGMSRAAKHGIIVKNGVLSRG